MEHYLKYISLGILVFQNTALVLMMRYSRTLDGPRYLASTAVVLMEALKFSVCFCMVLYECDLNMLSTLRLLKMEIVDKRKETLKVSVPSVLYTLQNNLLYIALTYLDAATFQVTYQLKILTTALFSVVLLNRKLNHLKWISLIILMAAVALVQLPSTDTSSSLSPTSSLSSSIIGLIAVLLACITSGFAGVFTEKILKGSDTSMWIRNIQLSLFSFFIGLFGVFITEWRAVMDEGFFQGYSTVVVIVICLQALGGLVVAAVMKYADNILKGFASSISIVFSSIVSYFLLGDFHPSWLFLIGATLVLLATFLYSQPVQAKPIQASLLPMTNDKIPKDS